MKNQKIARKGGSAINMQNIRVIYAKSDYRKYMNYLIKACYYIIDYIITTRKSPGNLREKDIEFDNDGNVKINNMQVVDVPDDKYNSLENYYNQGNYAAFMYLLCAFKPLPYDMAKDNESIYMCLMLDPRTNKEYKNRKNFDDYFNAGIKKMIEEKSKSIVPPAESNVETNGNPVVDSNTTGQTSEQVSETVVSNVLDNVPNDGQVNAVQVEQSVNTSEPTQSAGKKKTRTKRRFSKTNKNKKQTKRRQKRTRKN